MNSETIIMLKRELQAYYNNASKGGAYRRRNMILLRWDIRKLEESNKVNIGCAKTKYNKNILPHVSIDTR